ncbi:hypothetical protein G6N82_11795 [Altererythrobacter sp. BO-6]|uniref:acetyl-CoA hydrolase/transferase C-terminal domain-containing protein n=1 Tax=Altererythrobacter sp. BO-6 TaxID=2604537 RepID=UPI0013E14ED0|nr:acetyl-CoA hydrolase/transferase C-terminal domain-containing protein [Altererythrobacter sp. BO-6]QIG54748.1 hypothetical protein G6N82_11795 [Altererythrobacter sp. BO-6]
MLSPPDDWGNCSFGVDPGFGADLWRKSRVRIAHINPAMPRTPGDAGIPFSELTAWFEAEQPLLAAPSVAIDDTSRQIASHAVQFIGDGATIQTGLGKLPDAVLDMLHDRRNLRIHTGLAGDGVGRLLHSGALADGKSALVGCAIGGRQLYDEACDPRFNFRPVSNTHNPALLAQIERLVTINSVMSVDLFGQGFAEALGQAFVSGPGGASDFARGARAAQGGCGSWCCLRRAKGKAASSPPAAGTARCPFRASILMWWSLSMARPIFG